MKWSTTLVAVALAIATAGLVPAVAAPQQTTGATTGNAGDSQYPSDESNNGNLAGRGGYARDSDRYGSYNPYYTWQTSDNKFNDWYGNADNQWASWFNSDYNAYETSDEYGVYNSYYNWDTTTDYYDSWYGDSAEDWDDWFDHDTGLGYIGDSPADSDIYWF